MAQQDFARLWIEVDGVRCMQATSIDMETDGGKLEVYTIDGGFSGVTPGPGVCKINIGYAIPAGGYEVPFQKHCCSTGRHTIQYGVGPLSYVGEGEFLTSKESMSVKDSASGTVSWIGEKAAVE
jgi:hypothetical protein